MIGSFRSQFHAPVLISCMGSGVQAGAVLPPVPVLVVFPPVPVLVPPLPVLVVLPACPVLPPPPCGPSSVVGLAQPQANRQTTTIGLASWRIGSPITPFRTVVAGARGR